MSCSFISISTCCQSFQRQSKQQTSDFWCGIVAITTASSGRMLGLTGTCATTLLLCVLSLLPWPAITTSSSGFLSSPNATRGATDRCLPPANWPVFKSPAELEADPSGWGHYISSVYGEIPADRDLYPWCMGDAWMFYNQQLNLSNITDIPPLPSLCPMYNTVRTEFRVVAVVVGLFEML